MTTTPLIAEKRGADGTNVFGLYVTLVGYTDDALVFEERYFVAGNMVCKMVRGAGASSAPWNAYKLSDHPAARELLNLNISRHEGSGVGIYMYTPILVELSHNDLSAIGAGEGPFSRFDGTRHFEATFGEIDDRTWAVPE